MTEVAIARKQEIFAVKETTRGTLVFPSATDFILGAGYAEVNQQPTFTNSEEVRDSRDITDRFQDRTPPGEWTVPLYHRPSGSAGTAPMASIMYEALMGVKTVNAGTSVVYSQSLTKPSFSLWVKKDHVVLFCRGCTVSAMNTELQTTGAVMGTFSGGFMEMGWVGTDNLNGGEPISETAIVVDNAKKYKSGGKVEFYKNANSTTYDNSGSGYAVTNVDVGTNTLTISPGLEVALDDGDIVRPFLPTGTVSGSPIEARTGTAEIDSVETKVKTMAYNVEDPVQYLEDEITLTEYVESYVEMTRNITVDLSVYMRPDDIQYFYDGQNNNQIPMKLKAGAAAGSLLEISSPVTELNVPEIEDVDPTIALNMEGQVLGNTGEDSLTITFK